MLGSRRDARLGHGQGAYEMRHTVLVHLLCLYLHVMRHVPQAQEITTPSTVVSMLGILANILFHHFTCNVRGMGVYGAGLALSMTVIFMLFTLLVYIWVGK